jgi:glucokinase
MPAQGDEYVIGIDVGGTNITAGLVNGAGEIVAGHKIDTEATEGAEHVLDRIARAIDELLDQAGARRQDIQAVGLGVPGAVDSGRGRVLEAPNLRWNDLGVAKRLSKRIELPITLENDVNVGTWGEYRAGAARDAQAVFGIFVGTGIGGAFIFNDGLYAGAFGTAGEVGHTVIDLFAPYGSRTLEQLASRSAIVNRLTTMVQSNHPSDLPRIAGSKWPGSVRSKPIAKAIAAEDPLTVDVVRQAAHVIGVSIANVVTLFSVDCVVVGGGLAEALGKPFMQWIRESFDRHVFPERCRECKIHLSKLGDDAGIIGAALLARERHVR